MKRTSLRSIVLLLFSGAGFVTSTSLAQAQKLDVAIGISTIAAPSASEADSNHFPQSLNGGAYPVFSMDALIFKNLGVQGELAWKGGRSQYDPTFANVPYRPLFWDFNAIWVPKLAQRTYAELMGGIGAQSTRFYVGTTCGSFSCTNYQSSNHFMGHLGAGIRLYATHDFFIRPEAHLYLVHNNTDFSSAHAVRYGLSIGYSFGGR